MRITADDLQFVILLVVACRLVMYQRLATDSLYRTETYVRRRDTEYRPLEDQRYVTWLAAWSFWTTVVVFAGVYFVARLVWLA